MQEAVDWARSRMSLEGPVGPCLAYSMVDAHGDFVAVVVEERAVQVARVGANPRRQGAGRRRPLQGVAAGDGESRR